jgi:hypothetical protein
MKNPAIIRFAAFVDDGERRIIKAAARLLGKALTKAEGMAREVEVDFAEGACQLAENATIRIASLLPEVARFETPWREEEARLRALYAPLCESGAPLLFLTVLRHVAPSADGVADRIRLRIRRLNLLAIELSREFGVCVVDLDRVLADVGARRLRTDYRLGGDAIDLAAKTIATGIVVDALDGVVSFEVQDSARAAIAAQPVAVAAAPVATMGQNLMTLGRGRRRQTVTAVTQVVQADHVGWLLRQVVRGQLGPREAVTKVAMVLRRRGVRSSLALLTSGLGRMIERKG